MNTGRFKRQHGYSCGGEIHPLYYVWRSMKKRCYLPSDPAYKNYGARGINVCRRWMKFKNFARDMAASWRKGLTIERCNNDLGYSPGNCIWATMKEQQNNRRDNVRLLFQGVTRTIAGWADHLGMRSNTLVNRLGIYGWSLERALTVAVRKRSPNKKRRTT